MVSISILVSSCASKATDISASFVSPAMYNNYDCSQIATEMQRYTNQVTELTAKQNKIYKNFLIKLKLIHINVVKNI